MMKGLISPFLKARPCPGIAGLFQKQYSHYSMLVKNQLLSRPPVFLLTILREVWGMDTISGEAALVIIVLPPF